MFAKNTTYREAEKTSLFPLHLTVTFTVSVAVVNNVRGGGEPDRTSLTSGLPLASVIPLAVAEAAAPFVVKVHNLAGYSGSLGR